MQEIRTRSIIRDVLMLPDQEGICANCHLPSKYLDVMIHPTKGVKPLCPICAGLKQATDPRWKEASSVHSLSLVIQKDLMAVH